MERKTVTAQQESRAGDRLAVNIKNFYYPDMPYSPNLVKELGFKMGAIRQKAQKFYPADMERADIVRDLANYSKADLDELMGL